MSIVFQEWGKIRVGRIVYVNGVPKHPSYEGFTPIVVMTQSSRYADLSPYCLKNEQGHLMENYWHAHKVYPWVPKVKERYSRWDNTVIWEHPAEIHVTPYRDPTKDDIGYNFDSNPNKAYWEWRNKLLATPQPIRYPVGNTCHRKLCMYHLLNGEKLTTVEARRKVYLAEYARLVKRVSLFKSLQDRVAKGENILIIEVDGPHQESLPRYVKEHGVAEDFIDGHTMLATKENIEIMLNDTTHSFGHGYCLALALYYWA